MEDQKEQTLMPFNEAFKEVVSNLKDQPLFLFILGAGILFLIAIAKGVVGIGTGIQSNARYYFLAGMMILSVGFGSCAFAINSGLVPFSI